MASLAAERGRREIVEGVKQHVLASFDSTVEKRTAQLERQGQQAVEQMKLQHSVMVNDVSGVLERCREQQNSMIARNEQLMQTLQGVLTLLNIPNDLSGGASPSSGDSSTCASLSDAIIGTAGGTPASPLVFFAPTSSQAPEASPALPSSPALKVSLQSALAASLPTPPPVSGDASGCWWDPAGAAGFPQSVPTFPFPVAALPVGNSLPGRALQCEAASWAGAAAPSCRAAASATATTPTGRSGVQLSLAEALGPRTPLSIADSLPCTPTAASQQISPMGGSFGDAGRKFVII